MSAILCMDGRCLLFFMFPLWYALCSFLRQQFWIILDLCFNFDHWLFNYSWSLILCPKSSNFFFLIKQSTLIEFKPCLKRGILYLKKIYQTLGGIFKILSVWTNEGKKFQNLHNGQRQSFNLFLLNQKDAIVMMD